MSSEKLFYISSPKDFIPICKDIINHRYPSTIVLQGELGAGKTTFVRVFVEQLDLSIMTSSPTFTLMNTYQTESITINHFDLYRLSGIAEALEWGFEEFVTESDFSFIEWAERAMEAIPKPYTLIDIQHGKKETERILTITRIE